MKKDINEYSEKTVNQMNDLIETQRQQVDSFNSGAKQLQKEWKKEVMVEVNKRFERSENEQSQKEWKEEVMMEVNKKLENLENERYYQSLKDRVFRKRQNLVLIGIPEDPDKSTAQIVKDFFAEALKIQNVKILSDWDPNRVQAMIMQDPSW